MAEISEKYKIEEIIATSSLFQLFKAIDLESSNTVTLKVVKNNKPSAISILRNEHRILTVIDGFLGRTSLQLTRIDENPCLVLNYIPGVTLTESLFLNFPLAYKIQCFLKLIDSLEYLQNKNILHLDLNPSNLLYNTQTQCIDIIDFGSAIETASNKTWAEMPSNLYVDFGYMSPELTGRLNRNIDVRSDIYSMGMVLYHVLTGRPPFENKDPISLVYSQVALMPEKIQIISPQVPDMLSSIVMKLIEKSPEDRYQSWAGLKQDLVLFLKAEEENHWPTDFVAGKSDTSAIFRTPGIIFGRETETKILTSQLNDVLSGKASTIFISGAKGLGKTSLVKELLKPLSEKKLHISIGSSDILVGKSPYQLVINTLENLFQWYLTLDDEELDMLRKRIISENGENLGLITRLVPSAAILLGQQTEVEKLPAVESANRLNRAFRSFILSLSSPEIPVVLFFDNLHLADALSLELLADITADPDLQFIFIIGAYEIADNPSWIGNLQKIESIKQSQSKIIQISLKNLTLKSVYEYLLHSFKNIDIKDAETLSEILYGNCKGNPAMLLDLIENIQENGCIVFDHNSHKWICDFKSIKQIKVSANFIDVLKSRISSLNGELKSLLAKAAIFGSQFSIDALAKITNTRPIDLQQNIDGAFKEYIIKTVDNNLEVLLYRTTGEEESQDFWIAFTHDEFIEELLKYIDKETLIDLHWKAAQILIEKNANDPFDTYSIEITNHLNQSLTRNLSESDARLLIDYNLRSARKIKNSSGWELAWEFYHNVDRLSEFNLLDNREKTAYLYEMSECAYLCGKLEQANHHIKKLEDLAISPYEKANINALKLSLQINYGNFSEAKYFGFSALRELGIKPPGKLVLLQVVWLIISLHLKLRNKNKEYFLQLPSMREENGLLAGAIIEKMQTVLFNERFELIVYIQLKYFKYLLRKGNSPFSQLGFGTWGHIQSLLFKNYAKGWEIINTGSTIVQQYNSPFVNGRNQFALGFIAPMTQNIHIAISYLEKSYIICTKSGDNLTAAHASISMMSDKFYASDPIDSIIADSEKFLIFSRSFNYGDSILFHNMYVEFMAYLKNSNVLKSPDELFSKYSEDIQKTLYTFIRANSNLFKGMAWIYQGDVAKGLHYIQATKKEVFALTGTMQSPLFHFYSAYTHWKQNEWNKNKTTVRKHLKTLQNMEIGQSTNTTHLLLTVEAFISYEKGDKFGCIEKLKTAENIAEEFKFTRELALISEILGDILNTEGLVTWSKQQYAKAAQYYEEWGFIRKNEELIEKAGIKEQQTEIKSQFFNSSSANIDLMTTVKLSEAISGEVQLQPMTSNLLTILIENAGAEYGCIMLDKDGSLHPFAEGELLDGNLKIKFVNGANSKTPMAFVRYAVRSGQTVVLEDAMASPLFSTSNNDSENRKIASVFCHPVISKGKTIAVIYLENNHLNGAFSPERTNFMELLSGQISISLENSILYENLEQKVAQRTVEITKKKEELEIQKAQVEFQKKKSDDLLLNILPEDVAEELKQTGKAAARLHPEASVMFMDIISFTKHAESIAPDQLVKALDDFFGRIDKIIGEAGIEKIKTIGDAYLCASGLPLPDPNHAEKLVRAALQIIASEKQFNDARIQAGKMPFQFRIGIHSGPVVSGVVGSRKFAFDIWGDTVNTASRMESKSEAGKINISGTTHGLIKDKFNCEYRGALEAKNKGMIDMYFVTDTVANI